MKLLLWFVKTDIHFNYGMSEKRCYFLVKLNRLNTKTTYFLKGILLIKILQMTTDNVNYKTIFYIVYDMLCTLKEHYINSLKFVSCARARWWREHLDKFTLLKWTAELELEHQLDNGICQPDSSQIATHLQESNESKPSICQNPARNTDLSDSTNRMTLWATDWTIESPIFMAILF